jgi:hypothetical protein
MALPFTINTEPGDFGYHPPFKSSTGNFYVIARTTGLDKVDVYKASDPSSSWAIVDDAGSPAGIAGLEAVNAFQQGDVLHIILSFGGNRSYQQFNMATDNWDVTMENPGESFFGTGYNSTSVSVRSDSDVIVAYVGASDNIMGKRHGRVDYMRREGGTWTVDISLDGSTGSTEEHYCNPVVVRSANNDNMHFMWQEDLVGGGALLATLSDNAARTLSPTNVLSTTVTDTNDFSGTLIPVQNAVSYDDGGTIRIAWVGADDNTSMIAFRSTEDGSGNIQAPSIATITDDVYVNGERGVLSLAENAGVLYLLFAGGGTGGVDQDLYYTKSSDDGATWDTPTEELNGVTINWVSANIYTRGTDTVLAYFYDDGGDQKYNEKIIIAGATGETSELPSDTLTLTGYDPQAVTTEKNVCELPSQTIDLNPTGSGTITVVDSYKYHHVAGSATVTTGAHGFTLLPGDFVLMVGSFNGVGNGGTGNVVADNNGSTPFTKTLECDVTPNLTGPDAGFAWFYRVCGSSEPTTFSFTKTGNTLSATLNFFHLRGVDNSSPWDVAPLESRIVDGDPVTSITATSITTGTPNCLAIGCFAGDQSNIWDQTLTNGFTDFGIQVDTEYSLGCCYKQIVSAGAVGATQWGFTPENDAGGLLVALKAAPAGGYAPTIVTTENKTSELPSDTLTLTGYDPQAVTTEGANNTSQLPSQSLTLTDYDPQTVTTENNTVLMAVASLALTAFAPSAETFDPNVSQLESETLTLTGYAPQAVTTENNIVQLAGATLTITDNDPQAVTTENRRSDLPTVTLTLVDHDPQAVTTENNTSELPSDTLTLVNYAPDAVVAANNTSELPSDTLTLTDYDPQAIATENNTSQLPSDTLTLTGYVPQAVTTENNTSELPSDTLTLTGYVPQAVTSEGASQFVDMANQALTLTGYAPTFETFDPNVSQLESETLTLTGYAPTFETFDPNVSQLESETLTLTGYDPQAVTTEGGDADLSQLPSQALTLTGYAPQAVTTEKHISELPSQALTLTGYAPTVQTFDPNAAQLPSDTFTLTGYVPQAVTTENNTSQLESEALTLTGYVPQAITTEDNYSQLPSVALTLTAYAPLATNTEPSQRLFIIT